jgi:hypothetical protein
MMGNKHPEVVLAAVDANFFNPFANTHEWLLLSDVINN